MGEWISVEDRLPEKDGMYLINERILGIDTAILHLKGRFDEGDKPVWLDTVEEYSEYEVTHWMPLPEPPKEHFAGADKKEG